MHTYNLFKENINTLKEGVRTTLCALLFGVSLYGATATANHYVTHREYKESFKDTQVVEYTLLGTAIFGAGLSLSRKKRRE